MNKIDIEEALRRSELQLREILDAIGDAIHVIDKDRRIVLINKAFMRWMKELALDEKPLGKELTEYVLRIGESLLALPKVFNGLEKKGEGAVECGIGLFVPALIFYLKHISI